MVAPVYGVTATPGTSLFQLSADQRGNTAQGTTASILRNGCHICADMRSRFVTAGGTRVQFGTAVNLAARICDAAETGSVFVSNVVRELSIGKNYQFEHVAELVLKGFPDPIAVARVVA